MTRLTSERPAGRLRREVLAGALLGLLVFGPSLALHGQTRTIPAASMFPDLIAALRATPGCLGVDAAQTVSGKQVIFAWFEDKQAVLRWYYSDAHVASMKLLNAGPSPTPMAGVPEHGVPVLAIASVTLTTNPQDTQNPMKISQVAIELYTPLPGGLAQGGRFAPSKLSVPGMQVAPMNEGASK